MQKTLLDFCERSTGESEEARSSAGSSISLESGGVGQELDTNSVISEASVTCFGTCCERGRIDPEPEIFSMRRRRPFTARRGR